MLHAVLSAVGTVPPWITHFHPTLSTRIFYVFSGFILAWQTCQRAVYTESIEAIIADFVAVAVTSVVAKFIVILRDTERRARLPMPVRQARFTSVLCTIVMTAVVIMWNALGATIPTKP